MTAQPSRKDSMAAAMLASDEGITWTEALAELRECKAMKRAQWFLLAEAALNHIPLLPDRPDATLHGWKPPVVFEPLHDKHRIATQADVDRMERTIRVLGECYSATRKAADVCQVNLSQRDAP